MTDTPPEAAIDGRLDALLARARADQDALAAGQEPDTQALEREIQAICADIGALPRTRAQAYLPRLEALTETLGGLETAMRGRLDGISAELKQHGARQSAVRAYGRAGSGTPGDDRA